ncbi:MAG: glycosyltransferase family 4 protein [Planctomycetota bacterium]
MSARPTRIAFVNQPWNPFLPPVEAGSIAIWNDRVSRCLATLPDHEIHVLGGTKSKAITRRSAAGLHHTAIPIGRPFARFATRADYESLEPRLLHRSAWPLWTRGIRECLAQLDPDVVHVHNLAQLAASVRSVVPRARIVVHMHCEWLSQLDPRWTRELLRSVDVVYGCSSVVVDAARRVHPGFGDNLRVIPNGVDVAGFAPGTPPQRELDPSKPPVFLFVGRISPEKGLHVLIEAFAVVLRSHPNARLKIVGPHAVTSRELLIDLSDDPKVRALASFCDGDYLEHLKRLAAPLGSSVTFTGPAAQTDLPALYANATIVVQPSLYESFGMPILEAMASSRTVIATRAGGMQDLVNDGVDGILVESGSASSLAAAMVRLLDEPGLRESLALEGRRRVAEQFDWSKVAALAHEGYRLR